jgi:DNA/RNA endonuclease YhcR with UshA esterase domain
VSLQKFCEKYPEYCNQELVERMSKRNGQQQTDSVKIYASDVTKYVGSIVSLEGVVMDVSNKEYPRRNGRGNVKVTTFNLYDKTGKVLVKKLGDSFLDVSDGEVVRIVGRVEEWRGDVEVQIYRIERIGRIEVDQGELDEVTSHPSNQDHPNPQQGQLDKKAESISKVVSLLRSAKSQGRNVYYDKLEGLLGKLGLSFKDIERLVTVKEVQVPGSLEKIRVVELRDGVS